MDGRRDEIDLHHMLGTVVAAADRGSGGHGTLSLSAEPIGR
jgi:hypothetical protein